MNTTKRYLLIGTVLSLACLASVNLKAQSTAPAAPEPAVTAPANNSEPSLWGGLKTVAESFGSSAPTNFAVVPYLTYAPNAPEKVGGGALLLWNISDNIGAGMGIDYLGRFTMPSGQLQLKQPIHLLAFMGLSNMVTTPFALAGIATPIGGAGNDNGGLAGIAGAGVNQDLFSFNWLNGKWTASTGFAAVDWSGAGAYSGLHYEGFFCLRRGF